MTPADLLGGAILASLVLYALLGGADFGGGIWDLLATGPRKAEQRALVEHAIGPIWEANHVWLILVVVVLFTGFPAAFAAISIALFVPLVLLLLGIVLRGAAFTFRTYDRPQDRVQARWGLVFSASSVLAPVVLGVVVGALASGRLRVAADGAEPVRLGGALPAVGRDLRGGALRLPRRLVPRGRGAGARCARTSGAAPSLAGLAVFACAVLSGAALVARGPARVRGARAPALVGAVPRSRPGAAAVAAFALLSAGRVRAARAAAVVQVALIVVGWGASQYPYLVVPDLTLASASAPRATQVVLALGARRRRAAALPGALRPLPRVQGGAAVLDSRPRGVTLGRLPPSSLFSPARAANERRVGETFRRHSMRRTLALALALAPFLPGCRCPTVDSGHRGIVFKTLGGGTSKEVLGEGMHFIPAWNYVIPYDTRVHEMKEQLIVLTSNGLTLRVDASVRYRPKVDELFELQTQIGPDYDQKVIGPVVRSEARKVFGRYQPEEIYSTKREEIERQIYEEVLRALEGKHVIVEAVLVRDVDLPETIKTAIADKLAEEQRAQKMRFTLDRERQEAQRKLIEAEGIAKYQTIVRQGLTQEYLQFKGIEATAKLAESQNAKVVIVGSGKSGLPVILGGDR